MEQWFLKRALQSLRRLPLRNDLRDVRVIAPLTRSNDLAHDNTREHERSADVLLHFRALVEECDAARHAEDAFK